MRTRLSIATGTQPSSSSAAPTPHTKVPTSRASRRGTVSSQQLAGGDENEDPSGTIRGKKRAAPSTTRDVETTVSKKKARGGGANVETGRKKVQPKKGARVVDSDEQESDEGEKERLLLEADEEEEEEEVQATATKKKGKGKGRATTTTTTTTGGRKPRASSTSRARLSTSRTAGATTSKKPIRSASTLTNAAQSSSHSHTASSTSTSTVLAAAAPTFAKPNGDRAHVSTKSSVAVLVPGTSSSEMERREALETVELQKRADDADAEMAMMDDEDDDEGGLLIIVPGSDEEEEEMGGDEEDGDDDRVEVERVGSEEVVVDAAEEEEEANDAMEDADEEEEGQEGEEEAKSRVLLDAEHEELPADDTEGMEKQFGNSEDSFEARPYPRRNLLPNFLSQAANAKNPFLTNDNANPTNYNSPHSPQHADPKGKTKAARPSHPLSQALSPSNSNSHSSNHDQPASPPFGTKHLLLSRDDPCVCGEAFGLLREEMEEEGGMELRWHEHVGLCEVLEGYKRKGWRVFREL